jgi:trehalose 6-phosphate phosphatase
MEDLALPNEEAQRPPLLAAQAALFLDFDGTLAAIAPRPDAVVVEEGLVPLLKRLHRALGGAVALVSGRPLAELDGFVTPLVLPAAGVHGAERRDAAGQVRSSPLVVPRAVRLRAQRLARLDPGLQVEDKQVALALHWRRAPQFGDLCLRALSSAARHHPDWRVLHGKSVAEVKPSGVSKGHAVQAFCAEAPFAQRVPVFVGDDTTDEDGFAAVQADGGHGIKVGVGPTVARYRLDDTQAVRRWLLDSMDAGLGGRTAARPRMAVEPMDQRKPAAQAGGVRA